MTTKHDDKSYLGNKNLKAAGVQTQFTKEEIEEYTKCAADPMYFILNYMKKFVKYWKRFRVSDHFTPWKNLDKIISCPNTL